MIDKSINQLANRTNESVRTLRYYITLGLVSKPHGNTRNARYDDDHYVQVRNIQKLKERGYSLAGIKMMVKQPAATGNQQVPGSYTRQHFSVGDGIELVIDPRRFSLTTRELRELALATRDQYQQIISGRQHDD